MGFFREQLNKNDRLLAHSLIILFGSMAVNGLNYAYQLVMGRLLGPVEYGVLGALFSLITILTYSLSTIRTVITKYTADFSAKKEFGRIRRLFTGSLARLVMVGFVCFAIFFFLIRPIAGFLHITDISLVFWAGVFGFLSLLTPVPIGILNGLQRFFTLTTVNIMIAAIKLGIGVLLVLMGYGVWGAMVGLSLTQAIGLLLPSLFLLFLFKHPSQKVGGKGVLSYSIPVFFSLTALNLLVNIDVILAKHYLNPLEAGYYIAASVIAKIVLFASGAFMSVMFPKVAAGKGNTRKILTSTLFYTAVIAGSAVALYFTIPTFISNMLFGSEYEIAGYIGLFGLALAFFSLTNVLVNYQLARKVTWAVWLLVPLIIIEIAGITAFHSTILEIIQVVLVTNIIAFAAMLFAVRKELGFNVL